MDEDDGDFDYGEDEDLEEDGAEELGYPPLPSAQPATIGGGSLKISIPFFGSGMGLAKP